MTSEKTKATIAASGMTGQLRELIEAAQSWHIGRWDSVGAVTLDKAIEALPASVGATGPVEVLDLDDLRPLLLDVYRGLEAARLSDGGPHESRELIGVSRELAEKLSRLWHNWAKGIDDD